MVRKKQEQPTEGTWHYEPEMLYRGTHVAGRCPRIYAGEKRIAEVVSRNEADARLMTAAKELHAALESLYTYPGVRELLAPVESLGSVAAQVESALAKAKGE